VELILHARRGVPSQGSFRETVQPLVRRTAARGGSVNELADELRATYGRAYRRADMLADLRGYRAPSHLIVIATSRSAASSPPQPVAKARSFAVAGYQDVRRFIAQAGVAVFSLSLVLPTIAHGAASGDVLVASSVDTQQSAVVEERISLPNFRQPAPTAVPTPEPTPVPTPAPTRAPVVAPAVVAGGAGAVVTASWYGPGFFGNRLPCWQWLLANGLPITFEADTWGVAQKTLPCGTMLVLTHGSNTITVPVVDRGPYVAGRELDLSPRVKTALGCTDLCSVVMQVK